MIKKEHIWIKQIRDSYGLFEEGKELHYCIFSYEDDILTKKYIVAKMLQPERLTILLNKENYEFEIVDVRGRFDVRPQEESLKVIRKWLCGKIMFPNERYQLTLFEIFEEKVKVNVNEEIQ